MGHVTNAVDMHYATLAALSLLEARVASLESGGGPVLQAPVITSPNIDSATEGQPFEYTITASGNPAVVPAGFDATGLPPWLSRTGAVVSGTPQAAHVGTATFTVTASNSEGTSPGVLVTVTVHAAAAPGGWTVTHAFAAPATFMQTQPSGRLLLNSTVWSGWTSAMDADMTDDLYDNPPFHSQAVLPVALYATFPGQAEVLVDFDGFGTGVGAPNKIQRWGYDSSFHAVTIMGSSSGGTIQLRLVWTG
jgi:hypothetical protein